MQEQTPPLVSLNFSQSKLIRLTIVLGILRNPSGLAADINPSINRCIL